jgi:hypothetical protein
MTGSRGLQAAVEISVAGMACVVVLSCSNEQPGRGETAQSEPAAMRPANVRASPEPLQRLAGREPTSTVTA